MNKTTIALCDELCALMGHKSWTKTGSRCTGKWAGTTDYSLTWDNGERMFISNGMTYFEKNVRETVEMLKRTRNKEHQAALMEVLREYEKDDAVLAKECGMKSYKVLGLIECLGEPQFNMIWWGVRLDVEGKTVDFVETGLSCDIQDGADKLRETKEREKGRKPWTAGGVTDPDYIIHGVMHQTDGRCYRADNKGTVIFYPFPELSLAEQLRAAMLK